jgi:hypothetical protein
MRGEFEFSFEKLEVQLRKGKKRQKADRHLFLSSGLNLYAILLYVNPKNGEGSDVYPKTP